MVLYTDEQKLSLSFGPVSFWAPTDRFPSGCVTLHKDSVGERGPYLHSFTTLIYRSPGFDVNASPGGANL